MEFRRRVPRTTTGGWHGRYAAEDDESSDWKECLVVDISLLGVGLELIGEVPDDLVGRQLIVQVRAPVGDSVSLRLKGRVVNQSQSPNGITRAGMEFVGLSPMERSILAVLEQMKVAW